CLGSRTGRCVEEYHKGVSISGNGPYTVTITPPLNYTYWQSSRSPGAWWCANTSQMSIGNGIENLTVNNQMGFDDPNTGSFRGLIQFSGAFQGWLKNVRSINSISSHIFLYGAGSIEVRDSYFYGNDHPTHCADGSTEGTVTYGIDQANAGLLKVE